MEKDILSLMEAQMTQASNTHSAATPTRDVPTVQSLLEDATCSASSGENVGQKSMGQGENDDKEKRSVLSLCLSAEAGALSPCLTPAQAALQEAKSKRNTGKKYNHARKNTVENKSVRLPPFLTRQTRASPKALVLGQTSVVGAMPIANTEVNVMKENRGQKQSGEKKKVLVFTKPYKVAAGALLPAASPVQPSPEEDCQADNGEIEVGKKNSHKGKKLKKKNNVASPWPLTVQAWASFTGPTQVQMPFASKIDKVNEKHESRDQKGETDKRSNVTSHQSTEAGAPGSTVALSHASLAEAPLAADSGTNVEKKSRWLKRNGKDKRDLASPWPLTVQAWASFTTPGPAKTVFQGKPSAGSMAVNMGQNRWPPIERNEEAVRSILPYPVRVQPGASILATAPGHASFEGTTLLGDMHFNMSQAGRSPEWGAEQQVQSNAPQMVAQYPGWRHPETHLGHQDFPGYTMMNFARPVDYCYLGDVYLPERMRAVTMNQAHPHPHPHGNAPVMGMQGPERERAESQIVWMGPWGGI